MHGPDEELGKLTLKFSFEKRELSELCIRAAVAKTAMSASSARGTYLPIQRMDFEVTECYRTTRKRVTGRL